SFAMTQAYFARRPKVLIGFSRISKVALHRGLQDMSSTHSSRRRRRLWRFASAEFDEASWVLRVGGAPAAVEGKPLEVLHELLLRAGEVVTKEELFDAVWPGVVVVEGSLATAISKLRKALGTAT